MVTYKLIYKRLHVEPRAEVIPTVTIPSMALTPKQILERFVVSDLMLHTYEPSDNVSDDLTDEQFDKMSADDMNIDDVTFIEDEFMAKEYLETYNLKSKNNEDNNNAGVTADSGEPTVDGSTDNQSQESKESSEGSGTVTA